MRAAVLTIGTEVLIGDIVNTNAAFIAGKLTGLGYYTEEILTIADDRQAIKDALTRLFNEYDVVICSGGLGPTSDDITVSVLAPFFHSKMVFSEKVYEQIEKMFRRRNWEVSETNRLQAMVPDNAMILENTLGTAPGLLFRRGGKVMVALPGVPFEMKKLMDDHVVPYLSLSFNLNPSPRKYYMFTGIGESNLSDILKDFEAELKRDKTEIAYLPSPGLIKLRLTLGNRKIEEAEKLIEKYTEKLSLLVPEHLYSVNGESLPQVVAQLLRKAGKTVALAESCTGGYISHLLTSLPGASEWYRGGVTAYSNEVKISVLKVKEEDIQKHGAVSRPVAEQMAAGARKQLQSGFAVGVTGVAGPDGGTEEKPVGMVWIAVAGSKETVSRQFFFGNSRERNITRASFAALDMLRKMIISD
jgi:nicotinamide-nucleotide amidase